jgi:hypothetical protein
MTYDSNEGFAHVNYDLDERYAIFTKDESYNDVKLEILGNKLDTTEYQYYPLTDDESTSS